MKRIMKNFICVIIAMITIFTLVGCQNKKNNPVENKKEEEVKEYKTYELPWSSYSARTINEKQIISNRSELEDFCDKVEKSDDDSIEITGIIDRANRFINFFEKYDDEYFKDKSLAIICVELTNGSQDMEIIKAEKEGTLVKVEYKVNVTADVGITVMSYRYIVVEIDKDVVDINVIEK